MAQLRQTDFLPNRFGGATIDRDLCTAHFLSFSDYLEAHNLADPADAAALAKVISIFKRSLQGQARLWIEDKTFDSVGALKAAFINRFSPSKSKFAHVKEFDDLSYAHGTGAEVHLAKIRKIAKRIGYGDTQVRDKFISTLPAKCRAAVIMSAPDNADTTDLVTRAQRYLDLETDQGAAMKEVSFAATADTADIHAIRDELKALRLDLDDRPSRGRDKDVSVRTDKRNSVERKRSSSRESERKVIFCDYCFIPNHKWRQCRKRRRDMEKSRDNSLGRSRRDSRQNSSERRYGSHSRERYSERRYGSHSRERYKDRQRENSRDRNDKRTDRDF